MINSVNWFEIPVHDMDRAVRFYETLTGTALKRESYAPGEEMAVFVTESQAGVTGALVKTAEQLPHNGGTMVYLNAEPSIDTWMARLADAGGTVVVPKTAVPIDGAGYFAHVIDSEGNRLGLHAMA